MDKRRTIEKWVFALYALGMLVLLFHREVPESPAPYLEQLSRHVNLSPLRTIRLYWGLLSHPRPPLVRLAAINLAGNIVLFIPLGYLLRAVFPRLRKPRRTLPVCAAIICLVELGQMVTLRGTCDVDDLILNLIGAALGCGLYSLSAPKHKNKPEPT